MATDNTHRQIGLVRRLARWWRDAQRVWAHGHEIRLVENTVEVWTTVGQPRRKAVFDWQDVDRVDAWRLENILTDQLRVELTVGEEWYIATEDAKGWNPFLEALSLRLIGCHDGVAWRDEAIASPADQTHRTLFERTAP